MLFLRPTESATVFLQQLGRGLRLSPEKDCLTVLDFVGSQNANFRFDLRYRAMTGLSRRELSRQIEADFPTLPSGCHIELDRDLKQQVLANVRAALRLSKAVLTRELRELGECTLDEFLAETGVELEDVYRRPWGGWTGLRRAAGLEASVDDAEDKRIGGAIGRLLHVDDTARLDRLDLVAAGGPLAVDRLARMVAAGVWSIGAASGGGTGGDPVAAVAGRQVSAARRRELGELSRVLRERIHRVPPPLAVAPQQPLQVHARYTRAEALLAFGMADPGSLREGVKWFADEQADVFFVTLRKTEDHYSPTTTSADRAISPTVFQWESQSTTSTASPTGQRYVHHRERGSTVHLFLRETNVADGALGAPPFQYAGTMSYFSHTGDRPMRIT